MAQSAEERAENRKNREGKKLKKNDYVQVINPENEHYGKRGWVQVTENPLHTMVPIGVKFKDENGFCNFRESELTILGSVDDDNLGATRKVSRDNIIAVAKWCGGTVTEPYAYPAIKLHTGFSTDPNFRVTVNIGDVIEKREDGKWQVWVGGEPKEIQQDDSGNVSFVPEDRPYMKKDREFYPLAEAVAFVNAGFYEGKLATDDIYVVWFCSTLKNWKALVSTNVKDNRYYEITHNGEKNETYVDMYVKHQQLVVDRDTDKATLIKIDNFDI